MHDSRSSTDTTDTLPTVISVDDVAGIFKRTTRWCYMHYMELGGVRIGGSVFFTKEGLAYALQRGYEVESVNHAERRAPVMPERYERRNKDVGSRRKIADSERRKEAVERAERHGLI